MEVQIDGEKFDLDPDTIDGILGAMEQTAKDGVEHGFLMCDTPQGIVPGKTCTGNQCSIHLEDCEGKGTVVGGFHSHPVVTSFSMPDYIHGVGKAKEHPQNRHLLCVSLLDKGVRCKALKTLPPEGTMFLPFDTEENREKIKPYFTKRVNISVQQLNELLDGIPWEKLTPAKPVIAIDEGEGPKIVEKETIMPGAQTFEGLVEHLQTAYKQMILAGPKYKSELVEGKVTMLPIPPVEVISPEPEWVDIKDIESPDPALIAPGETLGYANAMTPVQVLEEKVSGKWKIHDGRHRLMAWIAAGYKRAPIVLVKP